MITPTVGRIVYFWPADGENFYHEAPLAAIITKVWSNLSVNLAIFTPDGGLMHNVPQQVYLRQPGTNRPVEDRYCEWMPYQVKKEFGSESGEKAAGVETI